MTSPEIKPCPWCGEQPGIRTYLTGHRDEPIRVVELKCKCGASRSVSPNWDEQQAAHDRRHSSTEPSITYERAAMAATLSRLAAKWNQRIGDRR